MPFTRHYLPEHRFVLTRVFGTVTDQDVEENILALMTRLRTGVVPGLAWTPHMGQTEISP